MPAEKPKPSNPGAGETHEVKGTSPEKQKKDKQLMDKLLSGLPGYKPKTEKAKKGKAAIEKKEKKLKKGTKEYKKRLAELTDIDIGNDKLSKIKITGENMTKADIEGKGHETESPEKALAEKPTQKSPKSGTPKRKGLV